MSVSSLAITVNTATIARRSGATGSGYVKYTANRSVGTKTWACTCGVGPSTVKWKLTTSPRSSSRTGGNSSILFRSARTVATAARPLSRARGSVIRAPAGCCATWAGHPTFLGTACDTYTLPRPETEYTAGDRKPVGDAAGRRTQWVMEVKGA